MSEIKPINNKIWNGENASFMRCVNKFSFDYTDIFVSRGGLFTQYQKMCEFAGYLNGDSRLFIDDPKEYQYWFFISVFDGNIVEKVSYGGIACVDTMVFEFDVVSMKITKPHQFTFVNDWLDVECLILDKQEYQNRYSELLLMYSDKKRGLSMDGIITVL